MEFRAELIALLLGVLQGVFEWLPISSEGNISVVLRALTGASPEAAVNYSLFLHAGTAVSAVAYYRDELVAVFESLPRWRPRTAFGEETAELSYFALASAASAVVGAFSYFVLMDWIGIDEFGGGTFIAFIGLLLIATGLLQRFAGGLALGSRRRPDWIDAVAAGSLQGLAILPGVSRSGVTSSALLLRGHDGPSSFRLSFILSIPAAFGAGVLALLQGEAFARSIGPSEAIIALSAAAVVGYLTIDALMRIVERFSFWGICVALGGSMVLGALLLV